MMGRQTGNQSQLFYLFNLERRIPADHLLRRINPVVTRILVEVREQLAPFYSDIGRPSIDPELMIRMLIVGYCYGIRFGARLMRRGRAAPCVPVVLPARSRGQGSASFDVLGQSARSLPGQRHLPPRIRAVVVACMACRPGQGRGVRRRRQRDGGQCQPLPWQSAGRDRVGRAGTPDARGQGISRGARSRDRTQSRPQATEGDLSQRSLLGLDGQRPTSGCSSVMGSTISSTSRTRSLSTLRQRRRALMTRWRATKTMIDRTERRFGLQAQAACRRYCLRDGQVSGLAGWPQGLHRTFRSGTRASETDGTFSRSDFRWDKRRGVYICPTARCCTPAAPCTTATRFSIAHPSSTAKSVHLRCSAAPRQPARKIPAMFTRMPATWHAG